MKIRNNLPWDSKRLQLQVPGRNWKTDKMMITKLKKITPFLFIFVKLVRVS